jgi:lipopolysaccharide/colanic/teichoic acid biosynthesis glycosyltransferase
MSLYRQFGKRVFDLVFASIGLLVCAPLLAICALLVRLSSSGPILFRQIRVGKDGRTFIILKFRTMVNGAHRKGPGITTRTDARVTGTGKLLRRLKFDELPQLWNVVKGDMSLVGPRPEIPKYVELMSPEQRQVFGARPGITDLASLVYRNEEQILASAEDPMAFYEKNVLPRKIRLSLEGMRRSSFEYDMKLILMTIFGMSPTKDGKPNFEHEA